jgi:peptidoglycan/LPS O-acetylase OafA/YrhL
MRPATDQLFERPHLPALDGLRAIAALAVVVHHGLQRGPQGDLGVTGFFVLSGFLITRLLLQEYRGSGAISLRRFYLRRTLRIFPAYYWFILVSFTADRVLGHPWTGTQIAAAFGYWVNYYTAFHGYGDIPSIAHAWSLGVEEQFYLLWPLGCLVLLRRGRVVHGLLAGLILVVVWRLIAFHLLGLRFDYLYNAFDTRFDSLAVGCLLAVLAGLPLARPKLASLAARAWYPLVTCGLLLFSRLGISTPYHLTLGFTIDSILLGILLTQAVLLASWHPAWRWLDHPVMRYLGRISYPIYLWHVWTISAAHRVTGSLWAQFILGAAGAVAVASASWFLIERPFLRLRERIEQRRLPSPAPLHIP